MTLRKLIIAIGATALLAGCGSTPEEKKLEAEAQQTEEATATMQEYKKCIKKAGTDKEELDACEYLLKAVPGMQQ